MLFYYKWYLIHIPSSELCIVLTAVKNALSSKYLRIGSTPGGGRVRYCEMVRDNCLVINKKSVIQCHLGRKAFCSHTFFLDHLHDVSQICLLRVQTYRVG